MAKWNNDNQATVDSGGFFVALLLYEMTINYKEYHIKAMNNH